MSELEPQNLQAEVLELDLGAILKFALAAKGSNTGSHNVALDPDKFPLIRRNIALSMASPVEIDENVLLQYVGDGFSMDLTHQGPVYSFSTLATEVKHSTVNLSLVQIFLKPIGKLKKKLLLSINLLDTLGDAVVTELRFINTKLKKCGQNVELNEYFWSLHLNPAMQTISLHFFYSVNLVALLLRYFSSDIVTIIDELIAPFSTPLPVEADARYAKFQDLPPDVHLFYRAMAEHTKTLPVPESLSHPYITAQLYPFQRKTVNWLLNREHVYFDSKARVCRDLSLVSEETLYLFSNFPNCDTEKMDSEISKILDNLSFGWNRILLNSNVCWYNNFTGNLLTERQTINLLSNLNQTQENTEIGGCGYLCEEMGLGKTVEIISLILLHQRLPSEVGTSLPLQFKEESDVRMIKKAKTTLIAAPESIIDQWYAEISLMCPHLLVTMYKGLDQYPELLNIPKYTAEFLQRYDIVLMNYSVMARELDFAVYSSQRASTREGRKRRGFEANGNENEKMKSEHHDVQAFQAHFGAPFTKEVEEVIYNMKKYDRSNLEDLGARARKAYPGPIPHTTFYDSPLMMCQWWRVVLDEIQMVAVGATRAFKTAAMIPRIHSWGVSGTPVRLISALEFLKVSPFNYESSVFCWRKLNNEENSFNLVKLWQSVALRHTKAMVHNDINLPPQERILLTLPFTELEQDAYNELLSSRLDFIGLNKDNLTNNSQLTSLQLSHLRFHLNKLRQLCANAQIGKLQSGYVGRGKNRGKLLFTSSTQLKTLESVLEDMISSVADEAADTEKMIVTRTLEICQVLENSLYPAKVIEILDFLLDDITFYLKKTRGAITNLQVQIRNLEQELSAMNPSKEKEFHHSSESDNSDLDDQEEVINGEPPTKIAKLENGKALPKSEVKADGKDEFSKVDEKEYNSKYNTYRKLKDQLNSLRIKLRSWKITEHKCYFLLASAHFQLYDPEYQEKIETSRSSFDLAETIPTKLYQYALSSRKASFAKPNFLEGLVKAENQTETDYEMAKHKHLEAVFYSRAELGRNEILTQPLKDFKSILLKKITNATLVDPSKMINDGEHLFPKTTKHLFLVFPSIDVDDLKNLAWCPKIKDIIDQYVNITTKLNEQVKFLNESVLLLKDLLSSSLLSADENPDGEEYAQSIDNQDKAACLMLIISQLLRDRENAYFEDNAKTKVTRKKEEAEFAAEAHQITDKKYLKSLQKKRANLNPQTDTTIEELLKFFKFVEIELSQKFEFLDVLQAITLRIRNSAENEKTCQKLLRKELNTTFNPIFNSRVEYFKQLQQISDTVENTAYPTTDLELDGEKITGHLNFHLTFLESTNNKLLRFVSRQSYLETLAKHDPRIKNESKDGTNASLDDDLICLICQGEITVGSLAPCGHRFCKLCLNEWLIRHPTCPMCKSFTDKTTVHNFTVNKPDIRAEKVVNLHNEQAVKSNDDEMHQVYKNLDLATLKKIQNIPLDNSYGSKVDLIVKQVLYLKSVDPDVQIVVFSQWYDLLTILAYAFDLAKITHVTAKNSSSSKKKHDSNPAEQFKKKENGITCFLLNAQIQASGLTLVNATHIFLCEPLIHTPTELQAISRIHRIGQTKVTTVWMFAVQNTVEENIVALGTKKRIEYLKANASESVELNDHTLGVYGNSDAMRLEEKDILTAESEAMSYGSSDAKDTLHSQNIDDKDVTFIYFGEPLKALA